jgi:YVTN family beta-propeller protein
MWPRRAARHRPAPSVLPWSLDDLADPLVSPVAALLAALPLPLHAEPFAYVPNEGAGTMSVIDTATDQVVAELPGGSKPRGLAVGVGQPLAVCQRPAEQQPAAGRPRRRKLGATVALGESPEGVSISPDGRWVVAAVEARTRSRWSTRAPMRWRFRSPVHGKNPEHAVFSPNGRLLFVSAEEGDAVDIIDFTAASRWPRSRSAPVRAASASCRTAAAPMSRPKTPTRYSSSTPPVCHRRPRQGRTARQRHRRAPEWQGGVCVERRRRQCVGDRHATTRSWRRCR